MTSEGRLTGEGRVRVAAIIPVGTFDGAKTRLAGSLDAEERQDLVEGLLARTVVAALAVDGLDDVLVISPDREVLTHASELGARTMLQRTDGLNAGLEEARADVIAGGAAALIVLPIDLPFVTADAVAAIVAALTSDSDPTVVLVTDRHGSGTNILGLSPPDVIVFAFGSGSRIAHRTAADASGASYVELDSALSVDLDTPDDFVFVESMTPEQPRGG
ncbi:MAG: 2-phospho-L-lactate guanylyltransferase [Chloroflexi bacterium]|nr:2-phospho-L-lactate guanylyltransferase [Chloroflexota bacterium]